MVFGGHGDGALPKLAEGRVAIQDGRVFRVDVEEVEVPGAAGELRLDAAKKFTQDRRFEGMEEEGERRSFGEGEGEGVAFQKADGCEKMLRFAVASQGDGDVGPRHLSEGGVEFDTGDLQEWGFGGDEHGSSLAGADIEKGVAIDGEGRSGAIEPKVYKRAKDGGSDAVVGGDVLVAGMSGEEFRGGDQIAGLGAIGGIEGVREMGWAVDGFDELRLAGQPVWRSAWGHGRLADLHEVRVAVEAEDFAAYRGDALRAPGRSGQDADGALAYCLETGETISDLSGDVGCGILGWVGEDEFDRDAGALGHTGDAGAGCIGVGRDGDGEDEAEVDDVARQIGIVAVAEGVSKLGFGEHWF